MSIFKNINILENMNKFLENNFEEIIYGGTDGLISIYTLLFALNNFNTNKLVTIGILLFNIIGDSLSMGISNYNSKIANEKYNKSKIESSVAVFLSFMFFGIIPVFSYYFFSKTPSLIISSIISLIVLSILIYNKFKKEQEIIKLRKTTSILLLIIIGIILSFIFTNFLQKFIT